VVVEYINWNPIKHAQAAADIIRARMTDKQMEETGDYLNDGSKFNNYFEKLPYT
jgi:hypothetical protein